MEAINLYMKAGLPARAARLAMSREVIKITSHFPLKKYIYILIIIIVRLIMF